MPADRRTGTKSGLLPVAEALSRVLDGVATTQNVTISLNDNAVGRVLGADVESLLDLPPKPVSAMDGYAVRFADAMVHGATLRRIGESAAGHPFERCIEAGETVRIFTGAIVPQGADAILLQEDAVASSEDDGAQVMVQEPPVKNRYIRPAGLDARAGATILSAGTKLTARAIALMLATGHVKAVVKRRPRIGILSTGDELVSPEAMLQPDASLRPGQVISSNAAYLTAFASSCGAKPVQLGIAADRPGAVLDAVRAASEPVDIIVTSGGASVGVHDHIVSDLKADNSASAEAYDAAGQTRLDFWKIAMRPGKPLISGTIDGIPLLGLPGNPVSTAVCALVFLRPAIAKMTGASFDNALIPAELGVDLPENDRRQDYLRARIEYRQGQLPLVTPAPKQDSSMISVLANSDALVMRPPFDPTQKIGNIVTIMVIPEGL